MVEALNDEKTRLRAARVLWAIGSAPKAAIQIFTAALRDENQEWRVCAAFSLWRFGVDGGKAFVLLAGEIENVKASRVIDGLLRVASNMLLNLLQADTVVLLFDLLRQENAHGLCSNAIPMIKLLGDQAAPVLVKTLLAISSNDEIPLLFDYKAFALLGEIGPAALPGLLELLNSERWRHFALEALGKVGAAAVPILIDTLKFVI